MLEISENARELLIVLARNTDGTSRWAAADLASIYERPTPNVEQTLAELMSANFINEHVSEIGRRKTDRYKVSDVGWQYLNSLEEQVS